MTWNELFNLIWSWVTLKKDQLTEEEYLMEQERINSLLKETGKRVLIISLRLVAILLSGGVLWYLVELCYQKYPVPTIIGIVIICLILVSALSNNKNKQTKASTAPVLNPNTEVLKQNAKNGYPYMRAIMLKVIREVAVDIGAIVPRSPNEIEVLGDKSDIDYENGIIYHQFRLAKQDIKSIYFENDLIEFNEILQNSFYNLWQSKSFPQLAPDPLKDEYGNIFAPVMIDRIDDFGNEYLIQTVFTTPAYMELLRKSWENQRASQDTGYNSNDSRFL